MRILDAIIFGCILIFLANMTKTGLDGFLLPMNGEEFDIICDRHFESTLKDGNFTSQDQATCRSELEVEGFTVTVMQPVVSVGWNGSLNFHLEGTKTIQVPDGSGGMKSQTLTKVYKNTSAKPWVLKAGS